LDCRSAIVPPDVAEAVAVGDGVGLGVGLGLGVGDGVAEGDGLAVGDGLGEGEGLAEAVGLGVADVAETLKAASTSEPLVLPFEASAPEYDPAGIPDVPSARSAVIACTLELPSLFCTSFQLLPADSVVE
jgi:hypothetical protein